MDLRYLNQERYLQAGDNATTSFPPSGLETDYFFLRVYMQLCRTQKDNVAECLSRRSPTHQTSFFIFKTNDADWTTVNTLRLESIRKQLQASFRLLNETEIFDYLVDKPETISLLLESTREIVKVFGPSVSFTLRLMDEPESEDGNFHLTARIVTDIEVLEARKKLRQFNSEWWFKQNPRFFGKIAFGLEFK